MNKSINYVYSAVWFWPAVFKNAKSYIKFVVIIMKFVLSTVCIKLIIGSILFKLLIAHRQSARARARVERAARTLWFTLSVTEARRMRLLQMNFSGHAIVPR